MAVYYLPIYFLLFYITFIYLFYIILLHLKMKDTYILQNAQPNLGLIIYQIYIMLIENNPPPSAEHDEHTYPKRK